MVELKPVASAFKLKGVEMYILNLILSVLLLHRFFGAPLWLVLPLVIILALVDLARGLSKHEAIKKNMGDVNGKLRFIAEQVIKG